MIQLLKMSLAGGMTICAVAIFRLLFQNRMRRGAMLLLWSVVLIQLLVPVRISAPTSIHNYMTAEKVVLSEAAEESATVLPAVIPPISSAPRLSLGQILFVLWAAGAVLSFGYILINHLRARRRYRFSVPVPGLPKLGRAQVRMLDDLASPLTYGIFHPVILLPPELVYEGGDRLLHVLSHESTHVRHWDVAKKLAILVAACIHWFNPVVWLMVILSSQDIEMDCDAASIRALGTDEKLAYAKTLISMEEAKLQGALQIGFSISGTAARLKAIVRSKVHPVFSRVIASLLLAVLMFCFFTTELQFAARAADHMHLAEGRAPGNTDFFTIFCHSKPSRYVAIPGDKDVEQYLPGEETDVYGYVAAASQLPGFGHVSLKSGKWSQVELSAPYEGLEVFLDNPDIASVSLKEGESGAILQFGGKSKGTSNVYYTLDGETAWLGLLTILPPDPAPQNNDNSSYDYLQWVYYNVIYEMDQGFAEEKRRYLEKQEEMRRIQAAQEANKPQPGPQPCIPGMSNPYYPNTPVIRLYP